MSKTDGVTIQEPRVKLSARSVELLAQLQAELPMYRDFEAALAEALRRAKGPGP